MPPTPQLGPSPLGEAAHNRVESLSAASQSQRRPAAAPARQTASEPAANESKQPVGVQRSGIGVLTSSLPQVHCQIMEARKADREKQLAERPEKQEEEQGEPMDANETKYFSQLSLGAKQKDVSEEERSELLSRSNLHSRSTVRMNNIIANMSSAEPEQSAERAKKSKSMKWQFGIRSRNQPLDAMGCIYKALKALGAKWECLPPKGEAKEEHSGPYSVNIAGATHLNEAGLSESPEKEKRHFTDQYDGPAEDEDDLNTSTESEPIEFQMRVSHVDNSDDDIADINDIPPGYFPKDPWHIHVRWLKEGMYPPGTLHPHSAHSSRIDLNEDVARRRGSIIGSMSSAAGSTTSVGASVPTAQLASGPDSSCFVYMDVQLYLVEEGCYLVDFKCAGYEGVVEGINPFTGKSDLIGNGHRVLDKDVTSPQPFLDLTNQLVIHLAKA